MAFNFYEYACTKEDLDKCVVRDELDVEPNVCLPLWEANLVKVFINKILANEDAPTETEWKIVSVFGRRIKDAEIKKLNAEIARLRKEQEQDNIEFERLKEGYENSEKRNGQL